MHVDHFDRGQRSTSPFSRSLPASLNRKSSLPTAESRSICSSQRVCSRVRNQSTKRRYSSGGRFVTQSQFLPPGPWQEFNNDGIAYDDGHEAQSARAPLVLPS